METSFRFVSGCHRRSPQKTSKLCKSRSGRFRLMNAKAFPDLRLGFKGENLRRLKAKLMDYAVMGYLTIR